MALSPPPPDAFEPEELDQIEKAFNGIWAAVVANLPTRDPARDEELQLLVSRKLFALAKAGVSDSEILAKLAWETTELHRLNGRETGPGAG